MKVKIYSGVVLLGIAMMGCTNLRPADGTAIPPAETWSTLNVTVKLAGAGWDISGATNIGLVLVPMTNTNVTLLNDRFDWSNKIVYLNPSASFTHAFSNISKNLAPDGGGKYGLYIFKDTNMDGTFDPDFVTGDSQPDGSTNIIIDGKSAYNVTFQKIRATFNITMPSTNDGEAYLLFTDDSMILIDTYPSILLSVPVTPGIIPTGSGLSFTHVLTFDNPTNIYTACYIDITNSSFLPEKNSNDFSGFYYTEVLGNKIAIMANITLVSPNIFSFEVTNAM